VQHNNTKQQEREREREICARAWEWGEAISQTEWSNPELSEPVKKCRKTALGKWWSRRDKIPNIEIHEHWDYCTFRKQQKSVHVTELGNGEGMKDTLFLKQVQPQNMFHFFGNLPVSSFSN